jgi:hypothetical protein
LNVPKLITKSKFQNLDELGFGKSALSEAIIVKEKNVVLWMKKACSVLPMLSLTDSKD